MATEYIYRQKLNRPALLTEGPTEEEEEEGVLAQHGSYLQSLAKNGEVLLAGRTQIDTEEAYGIVIIAETSAQAAEQIMLNDPAVHHGVMRTGLHPYKIAVLADEILSAV